MKHRNTLFRPFFAVCALAFSSSAFCVPYVYTVGSDGVIGKDPDGQCSTRSLQEALDMARAHPGFDYIHVASNQSYNGVDVTVGAGNFDYEEVQIYGGYESCRASNELKQPGGPTTLRGNGTGNPIISIKSSSDVEIINFILTGASNTDGKGGGIYTEANKLALSDMTISGNAAQDGAGIYFADAVSDAELVFGPNVYVTNNTAGRTGGGIYVRGNDNTDHKLRIGAGRVAIHGNVAGSYGGGIALIGDANADIRSPGLDGPDWGVISDNSAKRGGGVALMTTGDFDDVPSLTLVAEPTASAEIRRRPIRIIRNAASEMGGGIYLDMNQAKVTLKDYVLSGNTAPDGAAAWIRGSFSGDDWAFTSAHGNCDPAAPCNRIEGNVASASGAIIAATGSARVRFLDRSVIFRNQGESFLRLGSRGSTVTGVTSRVTNCLIVHNTFVGAVFDIRPLPSANNKFLLEQCTIADNGPMQVGVAAFNAGDGMLEMFDNIVSEAANVPVISHPDGPGSANLVSRHNVVSERGSLPTSDTTSVVADPHFLDRAAADYRLKPGSRAVDFSPPRGGKDYFFNNRDVDLPYKRDIDGARDAGLFEFQASSELVMNDEFGNDLRAWQKETNGGADYVSHDPVGAPGAAIGSLKGSVSRFYEPAYVTLAKQCIPLPLSGNLRLSGVANAPLTNGVAAHRGQIRWNLRTNSSNCTGAVTATGVLSFAPGNWSSASTNIPVTVPAYPNFNTSIELQLVVAQELVEEAPPLMIVNFDRISLTPTNAVNDALFANSFE